MQILNKLPLELVSEVFEFSNPYKEYMKKNILKNSNSEFQEFIITNQIIKKVLENIGFSEVYNKIEIEDFTNPIIFKVRDFEKIENWYYGERICIYSKEDFNDHMNEYVENHLYIFCYCSISKCCNDNIYTDRLTFQKLVEKLGEDSNDIIKDIIYSSNVDFEDVIEDLREVYVQENGAIILGGSREIEYIDIDIDYFGRKANEEYVMFSLEY